MEEDLTCSICCDIFTDPVLLKCSHSFCRSCLQLCWEQDLSRKCPVCRRTTADNDPPSNLVLKNLCETFIKERSQRAARAGSEELCSMHGEKLKLFCVDDEEPICVVCQTSERHENHKQRPIQEAAKKLKEELWIALKSLQMRLEAIEEVIQTCDQTTDKIKCQSECTAIVIREEFEKLHQFLQDEEEARLSAVIEEEKQKTELVKRMPEALENSKMCLSNTIRAMEKDMGAEEITLLQNYKDIKSRTRHTVQDPLKVSAEEIDVAKHLDNLAETVIGKMLEFFKNKQGRDSREMHSNLQIKCSPPDRSATKQSQDIHHTATDSQTASTNTPVPSQNVLEERDLFSPGPSPLQRTQTHPRSFGRPLQEKSGTTRSAASQWRDNRPPVPLRPNHPNRPASQQLIQELNNLFSLPPTHREPTSILPASSRQHQWEEPATVRNTVTQREVSQQPAAELPAQASAPAPGRSVRELQALFSAPDDHAYTPPPQHQHL
ncbi:hypothetical protein MATL_G00033450 [Megalops atlanticus]|uniref:Uncharacterized protein n=1 Tax=Megalops atlanticus TaxID=7932 RepID=A0A9D3QE64_MEGAT|nr:hypothetical protein MATL_G00033450 [Megalops atlanticus]